MDTERIKIYQAKYYIKNKARKLAKMADYYKKNRFKRLAYRTKYYKNNKQLVLTRNTNYISNRMNYDVSFKISRSLRSRLGHLIRNKKKIGSMVKDLGCSVKFLKQYLEAKFYGNMTWSNYGSYWQIDHIAPLHKFDLTKRKQFLKVVHYTNLQPLTIEDHKKKTSKEFK